MLKVLTELVMGSADYMMVVLTVSTERTVLNEDVLGSLG